MECLTRPKVQCILLFAFNVVVVGCVLVAILTENWVVFSEDVIQDMDPRKDAPSDPYESRGDKRVQIRTSISVMRRSGLLAYCYTDLKLKVFVSRSNSLARGPQGHHPPKWPERPPSCGVNEFMCDTFTDSDVNDYPGYCISKDRVCDQKIDCEYGEDEANCTLAVQCRRHQGEPCLGNPRVCILPSQKCDGTNDCGNWEDEKFCRACLNKEPMIKPVIMCDNGMCQHGTRCDGNMDCPDGSDELCLESDCKKTTLWKARSFVCDGTCQGRCQGTCHNGIERCNGVVDCRDGADETGCDSVPYTYEQEDRCIHMKYKFARPDDLPADYKGSHTANIYEQELYDSHLTSVLSLGICLLAVFISTCLLVGLVTCLGTWPSVIFILNAVFHGLSIFSIAIANGVYTYSLIVWKDQRTNSHIYGPEAEIWEMNPQLLDAIYFSWSYYLPWVAMFVSLVALLFSVCFARQQSSVPGNQRYTMVATAMTTKL